MPTPLIDMSIFETFLAKRRAQHGDLRMEVETPPAETPPAETPPGEVPPVETPPATGEDEQPPSGDDWTMDALAPSLQKYIKELRGENANYRTRATSAEQKLADAKTPEEVEAAVADVRAENAKLARELLVTKVAGKHELPTELAELLQGDDEAALEAHAKKLAKFAGSPEPGSLNGGLTPNEGEEFDPKALAAAARRRR